MAGNKYLKLSGGELAEQAALQTSSGAGDAGKIVALDSTGRIDQSMLPVGEGVATAIIQASENISAGAYVNLHSSGGDRVRNADTSNGRRADGYVLETVTSGNTVRVYFEGTNTQLSGFGFADTLYLSDTNPGAATTNIPTAAGHIVQRLGRTVSSTESPLLLGPVITLG